MATSSYQNSKAASRPDELASAAAEPNYLHLGPAKAGSTWIYNLLCHHPDCFIAKGKGLYYFDQHFDRGEQWYRSFFSGVASHAIRGDISHGYLPSEIASSRIREFNPDMKLSVCLRHPSDRAWSAYLDGLKNGRYSPDATFQAAVDVDPTIVDHGMYAAHLRRYLNDFPRSQIHVAGFDQLVRSPHTFANELFRFLGIDSIAMTPGLAGKMMPAGRPRSRKIAHFAKGCSRMAYRMGLRGLRGRVKRSRFVRNALYRPYSAKDRPTLSRADREYLNDIYRDDAHELDRMLGTDFAVRWKLVD